MLRLWQKSHERTILHFRVQIHTEESKYEYVNAVTVISWVAFSPATNLRAQDCQNVQALLARSCFFGNGLSTGICGPSPVIT